MRFLHENNVVHRDIKPNNILINRLLNVKLSDMGLSKQLDTEMDSYHTEAVKGSIGWQPSEVILNEKDYKFSKTRKTQKVDIFSLGCVFFYLMSRGHHPFGERFEREKNILTEQARESGKPENIIENMIKGRMNKFFEEVTLLNQKFVINPDITVGQAAKDAGVEITGFVRLEVGEGIEKKQEDFAAEVAKTMGG